MEVRYHPEAEQELLNEIAYLELRAENLGRRLLREILRSEAFLAQFPEAAPEIVPGIRKYRLRKFRYSLIYSIEGDIVWILAVAHQSRRPGYWMIRIQ